MKIVSRILTLLLFLVYGHVLYAQELPIWLTASEAQQKSSNQKFSETPPPSKPVRTIAEYEKVSSVLLRWGTGYEAMYREIIRSIQNECRVDLIVKDSAQLMSAKSNLTSNGIMLTNVNFLLWNTNSIWIRDYGPWGIIDSLFTHGIIDFIYNRPRQLDDAIPDSVGKNEKRLVYAPGLAHPGGNFMADGFGSAFTSTLIYDENPQWTKHQIDSLMFVYLGIKKLHVVPRLVNEYTGHIDMWMKLLDERTLLVAEYPQGHSENLRIEDNVNIIRGLKNSFGEQYRIIRIPQPSTTQGGVYRSYTNALFVNKTVLVPTYSGYDSLNAIALQIWKTALPNYTVVGVDCSQVILSGGAIHCIAMGVPSDHNILISHTPLPDTVRKRTGIVVAAEVRSKTLSTVDLYYRLDNNSFQSLAMQSFGKDSFTVSLPQLNGSRIEYYISAIDGIDTLTCPRYAEKTFYTSIIFTPTHAEINASAPTSILLSQNYQNPVRAGEPTVITFNVRNNKNKNDATLNIYDMFGRLIKSNKIINPMNEETVVLSTTGMIPGVYLYSLVCGKEFQTRKMIIVDE